MSITVNQDDLNHMLVKSEVTSSGQIKRTISPPATTLPTDYKDRKATPIGTGVLDYFGAALAEVARVSKAGNDQHNPGQPLHWAWGKSNDHFDCMIRHGMERGTIDTDGMRHSAKMAWRALALLTEELVAEGAPLPRAAKVDTQTPAGQDHLKKWVESVIPLPCR